MAKLDKIKQDNPELNVTLIDIIKSIDPSNTNKYCEFLIKMIKSQGPITEVVVNHITTSLFGLKSIETLYKFEEHSKANRISVEDRDITQHKDWSSLEKAVKKADDVVRRKELERETNKIYEDEEWLVIIPKSYEASQLYANGTKWCITQKTYWNDYKKHSRIIFVINRKTNQKYAISKKFSENLIQGWDAKDIETSPLIWDFNDDIWRVIRKELKKTKLDIDVEELPKDMIYGYRGSLVPLESAKLNELESFYKKYGDLISPEFSEKVIAKGKILREQDREERIVVKESTKTLSDAKNLWKVVNDSKYGYYSGGEDAMRFIDELFKEYKIDNDD